MMAFDAHLDLATNALLWNRDLNRRVPEVREAEAGMTEKGRCAGTVCFPEMREGEVFTCLATLIARVARPGNPLPGYACPEIAYAAAQGQRAYYRILEEQGCLRIINDGPGLEAHAREWEAHGARLMAHGSASSSSSNSLRRTAEDEDEGNSPPYPGAPPLGVILSMEGADPILSPEQVEGWWADGLRAVGPAHYGVGTYAHGTSTPG